MTDLSPALQTLAHSVPEPVARKLVSGGARLEPVEAKATVLLCDIASFTALTESLGHGAQALRAAIEIVQITDLRSFAGVHAKNRVGI